MVALAAQVRGARRYVIQQYRPPAGVSAAPPSPAAAREAARLAAPFVGRCELRGLMDQAQLAPDEGVGAEMRAVG
jgi:hypothetical protein